MDAEVSEVSTSKKARVETANTAVLPHVTTSTSDVAVTPQAISAGAPLQSNDTKPRTIPPPAAKELVAFDAAAPVTTATISPNLPWDKIINLPQDYC